MVSLACLLATGIVSVDMMQVDFGGGDDRARVAALDVEYQAAVKANDAATMGRILHEDFWLVLGNGTVVSREALLAEARAGAIRYTRQDEVPGSQVVRVWGDTAVVTAKLWIQGEHDGTTFDRVLWFSDTYVRTKDGWRYVFGQASLPLPDEEPRSEAAAPAHSLP